MPTLQMSTHFKTVLIIHDNNATGTGRKFFDPYTAAWVATYPDATTELTWGKAIPTVPIDKSAIFVGGRTQFFVMVGVYNLFNGGSATYSGDTANAITQSGSDADPLAGDTTAPNGGATLPAPTVELNGSGITVEIPNFRAISQITTLTGATIRLQIQDVSGSGGCFWNGKRGSNLQTSTGVIEIDAGQTGTWAKHLRKQDVTRAFQNQFGSSATPFFLNVYYTLSNAIGQAVSSARVNTLSTDWLDVFGTREAVLNLDVGTFFSVRPLQLVSNGDFLDGALSSGFNTVSDWARWLLSNMGTGQARGIDDTLNSIFWDIQNDLVIFRAIDRALVTDNRGGTDITTNIRGIEPTLKANDWFTFHFQVKSPNTTFTSLLMRGGVFDGSGVQLSTLPDIQLAAGQTIGASSQMLRSTPQLLSLPAGADKNLYFALWVVSSTPAIDSSHLLALDRIQVNGGVVAFPFTQRPKMENRRPYAYQLGQTPSASIQIDLADPIGTRGGYGDRNSGGIFAL
jgi:hypothetical protein